jgi:hypothetical protein
MEKIYIKHGEHEIIIESDNKDFITSNLSSIYQFYSHIEKTNLPTPKEIKKQLIDHKKIKHNHKPTPAEYYREMNPSSGKEKLLVFAKYLDEYESISQFTSQDINRIAEEVKLPKNIHTQYYTDGVRQGLLRQHGSGKYSLTLSAEDIIEKMKN